MFTVWKLLEGYLERRFPDIRILFVPCDSHGLQLLTKDAVEKIPWYTLRGATYLDYGILLFY